MKLTITRIEPTTQISSTGKKKYYVYDSQGDRHIAWGDWVIAAKGSEVEVVVKQESFKGNDYTVIWPTKETAAVASEVSTKPRSKLMAEDEELPRTKMSRTTFDKRDKMMAKESALKSAAQVWTTRVEARIDDAESQDPLDLAREYYRWILSEE